MLKEASYFLLKLLTFGCRLFQFSSQSTFLLFFHLLHQIVLLSLTKTIENKFNFTLGKTFRLSLLCKLVRVKRSKVSRCFVYWLLNHCFPNYDKKTKVFLFFQFLFSSISDKKKIARFTKFFLRISLWYVSQKNASNFCLWRTDYAASKNY